MNDLPSGRTGDKTLGALTALDWIAVVLSGLVCLNLLAFPLLISPTYATMFEDFSASLPGLTRLSLQTWFSAVGLLAVFGLQAYGLIRPMGLGKRRAIIVGAFMLALTWTGLCWLGLYLPIVELAGAIEA